MGNVVYQDKHLQEEGIDTREVKREANIEESFEEKKDEQIVLEMDEV